MDKVNPTDKLSLFSDHWHPRIVGELNDSYIKLAKLKGTFVWHTHEMEDEMFFVVKGRLVIRFRDGNAVLEAGEFLVIPRGVEHMPVAEDEVQVMLIEKKTTRNTGNVSNDRTLTDLEWI